MLPFATATGNETSPLTALFTSTTSVCVTGSVVVDTVTHWSLFGKIIILLLIQLGGLGIIAAVMFLVSIANYNFSLGNMIMLKDSFMLESTKGVLIFFRRIFTGTLIVEMLGALLYMPAFCPQFGVIRGIWYSFFTSVSAFCNAGIFIVDPDSLEKYNSSPLVLIVTISLIVLGGIGYIVWIDLLDAVGRIKNKTHRFRYSLRMISVHTRLAVKLTFFLIFGGALVIFILEYSNPGTIGNMSLGHKTLNSIFQSVTLRTAGFSTFPQENLTETSCLLGDIFMFIGGSPLGTAGGVKTVTFFILIKNVGAFLKNQNEIVIMKRRIPTSLIRKATAIISVQLFVVLTITALLMAFTGTNLSDALYETMSAASTVGLSRGLTPDLNTAGQILIIIAMFLGRIGPITMLLFFNQGKDTKNGVHYADGNYIVG